MRTKMRLARISKGLTAKQAAHLIGVHENAILRWESGEAEPLGSNLVKMAKLYEVDATVQDGGRIEIDPLRRTVTVVAADGSAMDAFSKAHRGSGAGSGEYIFERVPVGTSEISWDNSFGFDLTLYEEEGEPAWS